MRYILTLFFFFTVSAVIAQQQAVPAFTLGGKPVGSPACFKLADFRQKLELTPQVDSLEKFEITLARKAKPIGSIRISSVKELKAFDLYGWLMSGQAEISEEERKTYTKNADGTLKKYKAKPGDRILIEVYYRKDGRQGSLIRNFPFCNP